MRKMSLLAQCNAIGRHYIRGRGNRQFYSRTSDQKADVDYICYCKERKIEVVKKMEGAPMIKARGLK